MITITVIVAALVSALCGAIITVFKDSVWDWVTNWRERRTARSKIDVLDHQLSQHRTPLEKIDYIMQQRDLLQRIQKAYYCKHGLKDGLSFFSEGSDEAALIVPVNWVPESPISLENVRLRWTEAPQLDLLDATLPRRLRDELKRPILNNPTYRLLNVTADGNSFELTFGKGYYDDFIGSCEALTWETAREFLKFNIAKFGESFSTGQYDSKLLDKFAGQVKPIMRLRCSPLDLTNRSASIGVNVLTVMKHHKRCQFMVHDRSKRSVAEAINTYHVVPAGTFQPIVVNDLEHDIEFDLRQTVQREFAEEVLAGGEPRAGDIYTSLDHFYGDFPIQKIARDMFADPEVPKSLHFLGIGFDLLNLKPEFMLLLVLDMDRAEQRYALRVKPNDEGLLDMRDFTIANLQKIARNEKTLAVAQAIFLLACRHKTSIDKLYNELLPLDT